MIELLLLKSRSSILLLLQSKFKRDVLLSKSRSDIFVDEQFKYVNKLLLSMFNSDNSVSEQFNDSNAVNASIPVKSNISKPDNSSSVTELILLVNT